MDALMGLAQIAHAEEGSVPNGNFTTSSLSNSHLQVPATTPKAQHPIIFQSLSQ
jgi:hypothetical protein